MSASGHQLIQSFLANRHSSRGNLLFAMDATASREHARDTASQLQSEMFSTAASLGGLNMQLVYFRGYGEFRTFDWMSDAAALTRVMTGVRCASGHTQIARVLDHTISEAGKRKIGALVFVGDACEENTAVLVEKARRLAELRVPAFTFLEGDDPVAHRCFQLIADVTGGAFAPFNIDSGRHLADLLRAVAAFAVGGVAALENQNSPAATLLISQVKRGGNQ